MRVIARFCERLRRLSRKAMMAFFEKLAPTLIGIEACGASHHWARVLQSFGHEVKLLPPQLANAIRGYAAEFGATAAKGVANLASLLVHLEADESLPSLARELFAIQAREYERLQEELEAVDAKLMSWHRADPCSWRLARIPGIGPIGAVLLTMKTPQPEQFRSGRQFAAWIGLTPRDHSTGSKLRLGGITRAGDEALRSTLVVGATSIIRHLRAGQSSYALPWLIELLKRKLPKLAAVALANKLAHIAWKMMVSGQSYAGISAPPTEVGAA